LNYSFQDYITALKRPVIEPRYQLFLLHKDETIAEDLSPYLLQSGDSSTPSLTITLQDGLRRQATICLINDNNSLLLNPLGKIWVNSKFLLRIGINIELGNDNTTYWFPAGVFVLKNPLANHNNSSKTITLDLVDKFALLDGTVAGNLDDDYEISHGVTIASAINQVLSSVGDTQIPLIDSSFKDTVLPGNVSESLDNKFSDLIKDITNLVSASYFYDATGRLNIVKGERILDDTTKSSTWDFSTEDNICGGTCSVTYNLNAFYNKVIVVGNNVANENINVQGTAINKNLESDSNIFFIGTRTAPVINDNGISTKTQAEELANYNLVKYNVLNKSYQFYTNFIPHLDVNQVCKLTDKDLDLYKQRMLIKEIQIPLTTDSKISISCSNVNELLFSVE
jgi:hypothetical protein